MLDLEGIVSLVTLSGLQVALSLDNMVVIAIIAGAVPHHQRDRARILGLSLATVTRLLLLLSLTWLASLTAPIVTIAGTSFSGRDILMFGGGLFLIVKAVREMHEALEDASSPDRTRRRTGLWTAILLIVVIDVVFSLDSVMAAVGMTHDLTIMSVAIVIGSIILLVASGPIMHFIQKHPTVKMLALGFVLLIGVALIADGMGFDIPRGYLYFAILFSAFIEALNITLARRQSRSHGAPAAREAAAADAKRAAS